MRRREPVCNCRSGYGSACPVHDFEPEPDEIEADETEDNAELEAENLPLGYDGH
jgi:hypothetical protein